jgi:hypothetical protein
LFLSNLHDNGLGYSSLNVARSGVSQFLAFGNNSDSTIGEHPLVKRSVLQRHLSNQTASP